VHRRVDRHQLGRQPAIVVPQPQHRAGGEVAARARPAHRDPRRIDPQRGGTVADPADRRHHIAGEPLDVVQQAPVEVAADVDPSRIAPDEAARVKFSRTASVLLLQRNSPG
jgi:hypothetical protein